MKCMRGQLNAACTILSHRDFIRSPFWGIKTCHANPEGVSSPPRLKRLCVFRGEYEKPPKLLQVAMSAYLDPDAADELFLPRLARTADFDHERRRIDSFRVGILGKLDTSPVFEFCYEGFREWFSFQFNLLKG